MIYSSPKQVAVQQCILNRVLCTLCLLVMTFCRLQAQEVIQQVELQKRSDFQYHVAYQLKAPDSLTLETVVLKIFRRRDGVVKEVFTKLMDNSPSIQGRMYSFDWNTNAATISDGDELQARIFVRYTKKETAKAKPQVLNQPPLSDAGSDLTVQIPVKEAVALNGLRSYDKDGQIVQIRWRQISGPTQLVLSAPDFYKTQLNGNWMEGVYLFELSVTDNAGAQSADSLRITALPPADVTKREEQAAPPLRGMDTVVQKAQPPAAPKDQVVQVKPPVDVTKAPVSIPKKDTVVQKAQPPVNTARPPIATRARYEPPKLKGGPANALLNILAPGLGHYFVSGDHYGNNRKPGSFLITAFYGGAIGGAVYYKLRSNRQYDDYIKASQFREYQRDANGNVIGVRGASEAQSNQYLSSSKSSHNNALILAGVAGGILAADLVYTFIRGMKNKRAWKQENGLSIQPYIFPTTQGMTAGVRIQL